MFLVAAAVSTFYQFVVRPIVLRSLLFRMFSKRDALRRMAIDSEISPESFEFQYLQDFLCKSIALLPQLGLRHFFFHRVRLSGQPESEEAQSFQENAPHALLKMRRQVAEDAIAILILNSPLIAGVAVLVLPCLWVFGKFRTSAIEQAAEEYVFSHQATPEMV